MSTTYFSERERGPRPRMAEAISQPVRRALLRQIQLGIGKRILRLEIPGAMR